MILFVSVPIIGSLSITIEAGSTEEAIQKALDEADEYIESMKDDALSIEVGGNYASIEDENGEVVNYPLNGD